MQIARGRDTHTSNADSAKDYARLVSLALSKGGGLGFYGDFLFGDSSRMGAGPLLSFLGGPAVGTVDDMIQEVQQLRKWIAEGDERAGKDARSGAIRLTSNMLPAAAAFLPVPGAAYAPLMNMFYTRAAMDQMLWYRLQEMANPGDLQRYEQRMRRDQDVTFWLSPRDRGGPSAQHPRQQVTP